MKSISAFVRDSFLLSVIVTIINGYPYGAPENSCGDPAPIHQTRLNSTHVGIYFPQNMATSPYTLTTSSSRYINGMMIRGKRKAISLKVLHPSGPNYWENVEWIPYVFCKKYCSECQTN